MRRLLGWCALAPLLALACGGGGNDAEPSIIPGGGIGSGSIDGKLHVFVTDSFTDAPLMGASVRVGEASDANALVGTTDMTGLVSFTDVSGKQTITATATGHSAATWIGVDGANVTIPLGPDNPDVPSAHVAGTIMGWDTLDPPAMGHYLAALVFFSQKTDFNDPANNVPQTVMDQNICARFTMAVAPCAWNLDTRTGPQAHYAVIVDGDSMGTMPADDDVYTIIGWAVKTGLDLDDGQSVTGEQLEMIADADLADVTVSFDPAPAGLDEVGALVTLRLANDEGMIVAPLPALDPQAPNTTIPKATGDLSGATTEVIGVANSGPMQESPGSTIVLENPDLSNTVALGEWLPTPTSPTANAGTYSFMPVAGASVHTVDFRDANGANVWGVGLFDGTTSFTLPTLSPDPMPPGMVEMRVQALELDSFDANDFHIDELRDILRRASNNHVTFTH